ncbi:hypothetical protein SASPL_136606 [Salvia splendens]|uniref:Phosphoglycerate mutase n=1 Tax=Salvia splendens TaxID=180675 RepID=A0A8X8X209_SALSN|nr:hypothetical protein SASPL_136606 [Salvia splendens]
MLSHHRSSEAKHFPQHIILVRHGETEVEEDEAVLKHIPNHKIKLNYKGIQQARATRCRIREIVSENAGWNVLIYISPTSRTRETTEEIICRGGSFEKDRIFGV